MPYKKCPGCEENDILIQDKICYTCRLKITKHDELKKEYDEIKKQRLNEKEKRLLIAIKQITEQFNSYARFRKGYAKDLVEDKIRYHLRDI